MHTLRVVEQVSPHSQQLLHVFAGPPTVTQTLADNFIADVADEVLCLEPEFSKCSNLHRKNEHSSDKIILF